MSFPSAILIFLLAFTLGCALRAALSPLSKNIQRFAAIPLAFLLCYLLQYFGFFGTIGTFTETILANDQEFGALLEASPYLCGLIGGTVTAVASSVLFPICFLVFYVLMRLILKLTLGKLISKWIDGATDNRGVCAARIVGGSFMGGVGGVLLSAVLLMPIFYLFSFVSTTVTCARVPCQEEVSLHTELAIIDDTFVQPYENAPAISFYHAVGLSDLMCHTADLGGRIAINGETLNACDSLRNILTHVPNICIYMEAWSISDAPMTADFVALADDPFLIGAIADVLGYEAKTYVANQTTSETGQNPDSSYIMEIFAKTYSNATHKEIESNIHTVFAASGILAESNFFNDLARGITPGTNDDESMTGILLSNLSYIGKLMDALYVSDPTHKFSNMIFDILLENEEVQKLIDHETIDQLNRSVENGETTYESFTRFLQGLLGIITSKDGITNT